VLPEVNRPAFRSWIQDFSVIITSIETLNIHGMLTSGYNAS